MNVSLKGNWMPSEKIYIFYIFTYYGSQWLSNVWLPTFFKISYFVLNIRQKIIQVWNKLRMSKWSKNVLFLGQISLFKLSWNITLWIHLWKYVISWLSIFKQNIFFTISYMRQNNWNSQHFHNFLLHTNWKAAIGSLKVIVCNCASALKG